MGARKKSIPPPKNGLYRIAHLAGGPEDVAREIRERLRERGIFVRDHSDWDKERSFTGPIKKDVDLVIILTDMIGHPSEAQISLAARKAGIPFVRTQRKWTRLSQALRMRGFLGSTPISELVKQEGVVAAKEELLLEEVAVVEEQPALLPVVKEKPQPEEATDERDLAVELLGEVSNDTRLLAAIRLVRKMMAEAGIKKVTINSDGPMILEE